MERREDEKVKIGMMREHDHAEKQKETDEKEKQEGEWRLLQAPSHDQRVRALLRLLPH